MIKFFIKLTIILISLFSIFSCAKNNEDSKFFTKIIDKIEKDTLVHFKNLPEDSIISFAFKHIPIHKIFTKDDIQAIRDNYQSKGIGSLCADRYFFYSFYKYLNNKSFNSQTAFSFCKKDYEKNRLSSRMNEIENAMKINWIAMYNYNKFNVGDTVIIKLPIDFIESEKKAVYQNNDYILNKSIDTVTISGKILEKEFIVSDHEYFQFYPSLFTIKVIESNNFIQFLSYKISPNENFIINLYAYERVIKKYNVYHQK